MRFATRFVTARARKELSDAMNYAGDRETAMSVRPARMIQTGSANASCIKLLAVQFLHSMAL
ncbi:hypothetical protein BURKHO8Y_210337 [Burkholderia sp. 8Y]|nr:hypothetical protein BURKHO8Y_210337 [Burkholderia sp. 8Y]